MAANGSSGVDGRLAHHSASKHPLEQLSSEEVDVAREAVLKARQATIAFRNIYNHEPRKQDLLDYLKAEHDGVPAQKRPHPGRRAMVQYDVIKADRSHEYLESTVDLNTGQELDVQRLEEGAQQALLVDEFKLFSEVCMKSEMFMDVAKSLHLPPGYEIAIDPWPYGPIDPTDDHMRYMQGLCYAKDTGKQNDDTNHYSFPLPIIPVMDVYKKEIIRIDKLATGGVDDGLAVSTESQQPIDHCSHSEYMPELLDVPMRSDLKPLNITQPEGASFRITDNSLVEWSGWRLRISFSPRECAVLHDIHYQDRSILHRLSLSEMTVSELVVTVICEVLTPRLKVPYGDPRPPFHRKQAFDFGDAGALKAANNLQLGCDCLGTIQYIDAMVPDTAGQPNMSKHVVCIHEVDDGLLYKHTNFRTGNPRAVRNRMLVIQFMITLANYEYIFAYKLDLAGGITLETRATGIVSVVNIDAGKTSAWGNIVSPGALAQNHQHLFAVRIDPAVDGHNNTVVQEESLPLPMDAKTNPNGNGYHVQRTPIKKSTSIDASPFTNRVIKIQNDSVHNPVSTKAVAYKFLPSPSQLMLADPKSVMAERARFAQHHVWVTKHRDYEFWAGGRFTNQSQVEKGGCYDMAARNDDVENTDIVVWNVFGLTHNPRTEDWPIMPMEKHELHLRPSDFFVVNPALDVPGENNVSSVEVAANEACCRDGTSNGNGNGHGPGNGAHDGIVQAQPTAHLQGDATVPTNGH